MSCLNCGHQNEKDARFCVCCGAPLSGSNQDGFAIATVPAPAGISTGARSSGFWWLLVLGGAVAAIAAIATVYRIDFSPFPQPRAPDAVDLHGPARLLSPAPRRPTSVLLCRSATCPGRRQRWIRRPLRVPRTSHAHLRREPVPHPIRSDEVAQMRQEMPARSRERSPRARSTRSTPRAGSSSPRCRSSSLRPLRYLCGAVELTQARLRISRVVEQTQDRGGLAHEERILLQQIQRAASAIESGGPRSPAAPAVRRDRRGVRRAGDPPRSVFPIRCRSPGSVALRAPAVDQPADLGEPPGARVAGDAVEAQV